MIGGTLLSGGVGTVLGTLFGVAIQGLIQTYINFDGTLSSWWTKIAIGIFAVYLYRAAAWSDRAVGKSAECGGDAGERGGESLRNAPPAGAGGAGRALRRPGTL